MVPVGNGYADCDVGGAAVTVQKHLQRSQQHHAETGAVRGPQRHELLQAHRIERPPYGRATEPLLPRTRKVGGQVERLQACQLVAPIAQLLIVALTAEPLAIPPAVVSVLQRRRRHCRYGTGGRRTVGHGHLAAQHRTGPLVADDVVHHPQHQVIVITQPQQADAP